MADSLLVAGQIELIGGDVGVASVLPQCPGAVFILNPGFDMGAPQPVTDIVQSLVLDGEQPFGTRSSNRTVTLPIQIIAPDRVTLAAARELLLELTDQQTWTLTWTRDGGLPLILDCFRAQPSKPVYDLIDDQQFVATLEIEFQALPFGRSDQAVQLSFASPATGTVAPPSPVVLDNYSSVSGEDWTQSSKVITESHSARWEGASSEGDKGDFSSFAFYSAAVNGAPADITGLTALSVWAGFGTDSFSQYQYFGNQPVTFAFTLTDVNGVTLSFGRTTTVTVGASGDSPSWTQITASIPRKSSFTYSQVASYTVSIYNYSSRGDQALEFLVAYLNALTANPPTFGAAPGTRAAVYTLFGIQGTARAPLNLQLQQTPVTTPTTDTLTGSGTWVSPVAEADVAATGGGGAGASLTAAGHGGGGGGGGFSEETALALTIGNSYPYSVGAAGTSGVNAGDTTFAGDDTTVTAHGGASPAANSSAAGAGGAASGNTISFAGGSGAAGATGGGGGGHAASAAGAGAAGSGTTGGGSGAGRGGAGATGSNNGTAGTAPGGGGGGANTTSAAKTGGAGTAGALTVTYNTSTLPTWSTLIAHRPGLDAPPSLCPWLTVGNGSDTPNGSTEYLVTSLVTGTNARFGGTYSMMLTASSLASTGSSRKVTVTVNQHEFSGGPVASASVSRTFTPSTDVVNGMVVIGELTLPVKDLPPDNTAAYFGVTITDTNTSDRFLDLVMLDTMGETVWVNTTVSGYTTYFIDEPDTSRDIGRVMGSPADRTEATSVLDSAFVSGGPLFVDPGDNALLVYSLSGAPALLASYAPRWFIDRAE